MPRLVGSNHVSLTVTDVEQSAEWYQRVFAAAEAPLTSPGERITEKAG